MVKTNAFERTMIQVITLDIRRVASSGGETWEKRFRLEKQKGWVNTFRVHGSAGFSPESEAWFFQHRWRLRD